MIQSRIKVFIVDDHPMMRDLLADYLRLQENLEVVGTADSPGPALEAIRSLLPEVAIVDLTLRKGSGLDLIKELKSQLPQVQVVVLSMHEEITDIERAFRAGARGYVMKTESTSQILDAIAHVQAGKVFANPQALAQLASRFFGKPAENDDPAELLSDREMEVFMRLGAGQATKEIAADLTVALKTVQSCCDRIKEKLKIEDNRELIRAACRWNDARVRAQRS